MPPARRRSLAAVTAAPGDAIGGAAAVAAGLTVGDRPHPGRRCRQRPRRRHRHTGPIGSADPPSPNHNPPAPPVASARVPPLTPSAPLPISKPGRQTVDEVVELHRQIAQEGGAVNPLLVPGVTRVVNELVIQTSQRGRGRRLGRGRRAAATGSAAGTARPPRSAAGKAKSNPVGRIKHRPTHPDPQSIRDRIQDRVDHRIDDHVQPVGMSCATLPSGLNPNAKNAPAPPPRPIDRPRRRALALFDRRLRFAEPRPAIIPNLPKCGTWIFSGLIKVVLKEGDGNGKFQNE